MMFWRFIFSNLGNFTCFPDRVSYPCAWSVYPYIDSLKSGGPHSFLFKTQNRKLNSLCDRSTTQHQITFFTLGVQEASEGVRNLNLGRDPE